MAVHPPGNHAARRTQTETSGRADRDNGPITIMVSTFDNKATRHQTGAAKRLLHGLILSEKAPRESETASNLSQSPIDPFERWGLAVALGSSELAGIAETRRARVA